MAASRHLPLPAGLPPSIRHSSRLHLAIAAAQTDSQELAERPHFAPPSPAPQWQPCRSHRRWQHGCSQQQQRQRGQQQPDDRTAGCRAWWQQRARAKRCPRLLCRWSPSRPSGGRSRRAACQCQPSRRWRRRAEARGSRSCKLARSSPALVAALSMHACAALQHCSTAKCRQPANMPCACLPHMIERRVHAPTAVAVATVAAAAAVLWRRLSTRMAAASAREYPGISGLVRPAQVRCGAGGNSRRAAGSRSALLCCRGGLLSVAAIRSITAAPPCPAPPHHRVQSAAASELDPEYKMALARTRQATAVHRAVGFLNTGDRAR